KKIPPEVRNKAINWAFENANDIGDIQTKGKSKEEIYNQAVGFIDSLLSTKKAKSLVGTGIVSAQDLSILKKTKNVPAPIRALYGEIFDPKLNYVNTIVKLASLVENRKLATRLLDVGRESG